MLWSAWWTEVFAHLPEAAVPVVEQALNRSARQFYSRSRAWKAWLEPVTISGSSSAMPLPADTDVVALVKATLNGQRFDVGPHFEVDQDPARPASLAGHVMVSTPDRQVLWLSGNVTGAGLLQVQVALMPSLNAPGIPDALGRQHYEAIAAGARAYVFNTAGPWNNPQAAELARRESEAYIGAEQARAYTGNTGQVPRLRPIWC